MPRLNNVSCTEVVDYSKSTGLYKDSNIINDFMINGYSSLSNISDNTIIFIKNFDSLIDFSKIAKKNVLIISIDSDKLRNSGISYITSEKPRDLFFQIIDKFIKSVELCGISSYAKIYTDRIGSNVYVGDFAYICKDVVIGDNVKIYPNVSIICPCTIGDNTVIFPGVVIGADGFGMYQDIESIYHQIPHVGSVRIGKNVVIGSNSCIDRGTIDDTIIEDNVKIDNHVNIAHNVKIESNVLVIALSGIGGSTIIKENSYIAPSVLLNNGIQFGPNSMAGVGSIVLQDVDMHKKVFGNPARVIGNY